MSPTPAYTGRTQSCSQARHETLSFKSILGLPQDLFPRTSLRGGSQPTPLDAEKKWHYLKLLLPMGAPSLPTEGVHFLSLASTYSPVLSVACPKLMTTSLLMPPPSHLFPVHPRFLIYCNFPFLEAFSSLRNLQQFVMMKVTVGTWGSKCRRAAVRESFLLRFPVSKNCCPSTHRLPPYWLVATATVFLSASGCSSSNC